LNGWTCDMLIARAVYSFTEGDDVAQHINEKTVIRDMVRSEGSTSQQWRIQYVTPHSDSQKTKLLLQIALQ